MKKGKKLYEGKAKIIYATNDKNLVIQYFKDDATAFNNQKKTTIEGKGVLNNRISEHILSNLSEVGIKNHLVKRINMREQLIKFVEIIPLEFIVRNIATGSLTKRLGIEDGTVLDDPLIEYCLKDDKLGDPLVSKEHILAFKWASKKELEKIDKQLQRINDFMVGMFRGVGIKLVDFKVEFGRYKNNGKTEVILADEISPDTCRLWDNKTDKKLDKDRFRNNLGNLIDAYQDVARRLGILHEQSNITAVNFSKLKTIKNKKNK
jgi:phosphoribosylaminoimidazole-succinocarboxamide synthase